MFFLSPNVIREPFFSLDCLLENNYSKAWTDGRLYHPEFDHPESDRPLIPNLSNHCYHSRSDYPNHPKTDGLSYHPKLPLYWGIPYMSSFTPPPLVWHLYHQHPHHHRHHHQVCVCSCALASSFPQVRRWLAPGETRSSGVSHQHHTPYMHQHQH